MSREHWGLTRLQQRDLLGLALVDWDLVFATLVTDIGAMTALLQLDWTML